ncbi:hypothetical protein [Sphingomonas sp. Leaf242]|uniref:hypothetical protein n=1 Tax=Sphingomonas sp. Leaf242 TaxID=1736304 RepID=UPI0007136FB6|nr:hypothetical protein [Sphingomonas sp. Leaf242]KQO11100.1 hypothetical protein ASF09_19425 [Sphingomonas sp. Leaf242]
MPGFFIPSVEADKQEEAYEQIASFIGAAPRAVGDRIYSMTWRHNRTVWTATVGEKLRGIETVVAGRGRDKRERELPRHSDDTVLAIFPGNPGLIAHDNKSRRWNLPILTGESWNIVRFG